MIDKTQRLGLARVFPIAAVSVRSAGEELTDFAGLVAAGAVAFSDDGRPVKTAALMKQALEKAQGLAVPVVDHCEDTNLSAGGVMNEGPVSRRLNLKGIPTSAEEVCIARDLDLAEATGSHLHIAHVSTGRGLEMVRAAKRRGVRVTCEVTPHHFTLSDETVAERGTNAKMNPPLRSLSDVEALRAGIADGTVDALATDHAPHAPELKQKPIASAPFGVIGLETALAISLTELVHPGRISLWHLISLLSAGPARVVHKPLGRLRVGGEADITLFNPHLEWTYEAAQGRSKSRNSPFDGRKLKGAVTATIVAGKLVYRRPL
jgi:dihydroorotase